MKKTSLSVAQILEDFTLLESWQERYGYLIDIGGNLPDFPPEKRIPANAVQGCASATWFWCEILPSAEQKVLYFIGDSEAFIVKGLIVILRGIYHGQTLRKVLTSSPEKIFASLGLERHLSAQRTNGFHAMLAHLQKEVQENLKH